MERKLPLRQLGRSSLDLRDFWIGRFEYQEAKDLPDRIEQPRVQVSRPVVEETDTEAEYQLTLRVRASQGSARDVDMTIRGTFRLQAADASLEGTIGLLVYNGSSMLLGSARGIIESVTSLTRLGRLHVPSANLTTMFGTRRTRGAGTSKDSQEN